MALTGPKPKSADERRNRNKPAVDWLLVVDEPYTGDRPSIGRVPAATKRWWESVSTMPHCTLWTTADWQFAVDTAMVHKLWVQQGRIGFATELRQREKQMGTTFDSRRDLRIRYVPAAEVEEPEKPVSIADRRRELMG